MSDSLIQTRQPNHLRPITQLVKHKQLSARSHVTALDVCSGARGGQRGSRGAGALCRVERAARRVDQDGLAAAAAVHKEEQQEETKHRRQLWL